MRRMPIFDAGDGVRLHYEQYGEGFPLLLLAPGGMRSTAATWERAPWHPIRELAPEYRVIAMDQRNAGASTAPVRATDGWEAYTADQIRLLDHLGIERCHVLGGCIGGSFCLGLMKAAPERVVAAVLQQPIGLSNTNRDVFYALFDDWRDALDADRTRASMDAWSAFRERMYGGDFVFNVSREWVQHCEHPMLVLMGNDVYHPSETSRQIAALAPRGELVERWKEPPALAGAVSRVREFLRSHTPA
jgi:pimeloyl-ACP methyl ester carboxylesterase